ncbi:MAG TPA: hypothetical protein DCE80_04895 [Ignavibacteriales bacterium]|nr:MAG: hypothetical protein A2058_07205 [Ignavibacteria bacterium GWA2_36_19]HAB51502.1 hypothetical protein [Ignavibacteriales bacterium]
MWRVRIELLLDPPLVQDIKIGTSENNIAERPEPNRLSQTCPPKPEAYRFGRGLQVWRWGVSNLDYTIIYLYHNKMCTVTHILLLSKQGTPRTFSPLERGTEGVCQQLD